MKAIKSVLVTGANRGIGLEFIRQILASPTPPRHVIAACRNPAAAEDLKGLAASHSNLRTIKLDLDDTGSFDAVTKEVSKIVEDDGLQVLINNGGVLFPERFNDVTEGSLMQTFKINAAAPVLLAKSLRQLLKAGSKADEKSLIVNISSIMGSMGDDRTGPCAYKMSKAAMNMSGKCLSADLKEDGIIVCTLHPGWVQTPIGGGGALIQPKESVEGMMKVILGMKAEDSGKFFRYSGNELPW